MTKPRAGKGPVGSGLEPGEVRSWSCGEPGRVADAQACPHLVGLSEQDTDEVLLHHLSWLRMLVPEVQTCRSAQRVRISNYGLGIRRLGCESLWANS